MQKSLVEEAAQALANKISGKLSLGKNVLFFATGGSGMDVCIKVSEILRNQPHENLTVTLTDERYGAIGHADSNWQQLMEKGFSLPDAKLIPVLTGDDASATANKFNQKLNGEFKKDSYKIGLFGIGADGHTAGILPHTGAVDSPDLAYTYKTEKFERITITPKAILALDEAVVYAKGEEKWKTLEDLQASRDIHDQPAQILKTVPLLTMFTDYQK